MTSEQIMQTLCAEAVGTIGVAELARRTGLNRVSLHRTLKGQQSPPLRNIVKICRVLNFTLVAKAWD